MLLSTLKSGLNRQFNSIQFNSIQFNSIQFNSIQSFLFLVTLQVLLLISLSTSAIGQNIFPVVAPWETGIGSALIGTFPNQFPQKPLHLHTFPSFGRHPFAPPLIPNDPAFRISSGPDMYSNTSWGHLVLITSQNDIIDPAITPNKYYSNVANFNSQTQLGDFVLQASERAEDLVLVARSSTGRIRFATSPSSNTDVERMTILPNGNVGIGTINPLSKLVVNGQICAQEVRVSLSGAPCWPDNVFNENYKLLTLEQLEEIIKSENHLPEVPSAAEVATNGIEIGEMQATLLKKIEEITLYLIQLKKENEILKSKVSILENKN